MTYSYSLDEENYSGDFETPESAAVEAFYDDTELETVWVGESKKPEAKEFVSGSRILEDVAERAYDECGEWSEDWLSGLSRDKEKLGDLEKLVGDWIAANEPPTFFTVKNVKEITRAEMVAGGYLEGANAEVTGGMDRQKGNR